MAGHPVHPRAVIARIALAVIVAALTIAVPRPAQAHDDAAGGYRKWPWKAGKDRFLTTLPGECPHCSAKQSSSSWKAIDANLNYETVYSISPGRVNLFEPNGGAAGKFLRIRDDDGSYITYEHLKKALVTSGRVVAGEPIAVSACTGNCSGPHLHFQRHDAPSFNSNALSLTPISSHGGSGDPLAHTEYLSDNGGIGFSPGGNMLVSMRQAYDDAGGYDRIGISSNLGDAWSPCRDDSIAGTWFRYGCAPRSGAEGTVQTFRGAGAYKYRALMHPKGDSGNSYVLHPGILAAYTERYYGRDWVYHFGYPSENRRKISSGVFRQDFQYGSIIFEKDPCREWMIRNGYVLAVYGFCD